MRKWQSLLVLVAVVIGGVVVLAACGGSGGSKRLSKQDFVKQANAICKDVKVKADALKVPSSPADVSTYAKAAAPLLGKELADLRRLKPPASFEADVNAWLATGDVAAKALDKMSRANGDVTKILKLTAEVNSSGTNGDALAKKLGLTDCVG